MYGHRVAKFIHFRSNDELEELLEDEVTALRKQALPPALSSRSAVARMILTAHLRCRQKERLRLADGAELPGGEAQAGFTRAAAREVLVTVSEAMEVAVTKAVEDALGKVPTYLQDAIAEAEG